MRGVMHDDVEIHGRTRNLENESGRKWLVLSILQGKTSIAPKHALQKKVYSQAQDVN